MTQASPPSTETILGLLTSEIDTASGEQSRSGWSLWALGGTLAATCLFILEQVEQGGISAVTFAKWLIVIALPFDTLWMWLQEWSSHETRRRRFAYRSVREARGDQFAYMWRGMTAVGFGWAAWIASDEVWLPAVWLAVLWFGFMAVANLLIVLATFHDAHYKQLEKSAPAMAVFLAMLCVASASYARTLPAFAVESVGHLRLAAAVLVGSCVLHRLLLGLRRPWIIERLTSIRRELALGRIDAPTAARSAESVLLGMEAHTALAEDLSRTLELHEDIQDDVARLQIKLRDVESKLAEVDQRQAFSDAQEEQIDDALDALRTLHKNLNRWSRRIARSSAELNRGATGIREEAPVSYARGYELFRTGYEDLTTRNADLKRLMDDVDGRATVARNRWKEMKAASTGRKRKRP
jgi:hypothetical protein